MKYILVACLFALAILIFPKYSESEVVQVVPEQIDNRPAIIDQYFKERSMPLEGYGKKFVEVADQYGLDWRLLPAISIREQSGGKVLPHNCPDKKINYNPLGWGSGKICFQSFDIAIETVGMKLGTLKYYKGKTTYAMLQVYNPPTVVQNYAQEVMAIMSQISNDK